MKNSFVIKVFYKTTFLKKKTFAVISIRKNAIKWSDITIAKPYISNLQI